MEESAELWKRLKVEGDEAARDDLIEYYLPLVRQIAAIIIKKLKSGVEMDDLVSDGIFGLMRAIDNFDLSRGFKFETYATPVVRGAIYNGMRNLDWVPERTRGKARAVQRETDNFFKEHGRTPTHEELANELKMSASEVYDLISTLGCIYILSLDQPIAAMGDDDSNMMSVVENSLAHNPQLEIEFKEERDHLKYAIENLNEREKFIVTKHYFEGYTFESISQTLGVSKQRISQMHSRAVRKMREYLGRMTISDEALKDFICDDNFLIPPPYKEPFCF
jgi:RNA polymerase sigma factor for flagellar operon FliA